MYLTRLAIRRAALLGTSEKNQIRPILFKLYHMIGFSMQFTPHFEFV